MQIQPVILAKDKENIGQLLSLAPPNLQDLGAKADFIHLDGSRPSFWTAGIDDVVRNMVDLTQHTQPKAQPEPEPEPQLALAAGGA